MDSHVLEELISVIVPVYNVEKYLPKCLDSIINQTYKNLEIILVDDGSPDNCGAICDEYAEKDTRIRVIHKPNGGLSSARNAGVEIAKGGYIGFIDSDDFIAPQMYAKLFDALTSAGADLAICNYVWINPDGSLHHETEQIPANSVLTREQMFEELHNRCNVVYVTAVNKLYKYSLLNAVKFPEGKIHEDEFTIHHFLHECERVSLVSDILYYYLQREGSITTEPYSPKRLDGNDALYDRFTFCLKNGYSKCACFSFRAGLVNCLTAIIKLRNTTGRGRAFRQILRLLLTLLVMPRLWFLVLFPLFPNFLKKSIRFVLKRIRRFFLPFALRIKVKIKRGDGKPIVFLLATPTHGNLGDQAIAYAERLLLEELEHTFIEINNDDYLRHRDWLQQNIVQEIDIILIDGGGNLGTLWTLEDDKISDIISRFRKNKIIIFPQTCYYGQNTFSLKRLEKNQAIYRAASDLTIFLRDRASYEFAQTYFDGVKLIFAPDIVLSLTSAPQCSKKNGVLLCFRQDKEKKVDAETEIAVKGFLARNNIPFKETTTLIKKHVTQMNRKRELHKKWREFSYAQTLITDRLHAMIFAVITHTSCIALDNESKKVSGSYEWIKKLSYICIVESTDDILLKIPEMLNKSTAESYDYPDILRRQLSGCSPIKMEGA